MKKEQLKNHLKLGTLHLILLAIFTNCQNETGLVEPDANNS